MAPPKERVDAVLPLTLLQSIRAQDTPTELLPDENLEQFFPHRFGLSGVVEDQIRHFDRLARRRGRVERAEVEALLGLISRRTDAERVFETAGHKLAELRFTGMLGKARTLTRRLPRGLRSRATLRGLRAAHGNTLIATSLEVSYPELEVRATGSLTAAAGAGGVACRLYSAMTAALATLNGLATARVAHPSCEARGDDVCRWELRVD